MVAGALALGLLIGGLAVAGPTVSTAGAGPRKLTPEEVELWTFCRLNQRRVSAGKPKIAMDLSLRNGARGWSRHMGDVSQARGGPTIFHAPLVGFNAENVAYNVSSNWRDLDSAWQNSDGHRTNRMNSAYKSMGVGIAYRTINGVEWIFGTERFSTASTPDTQPNCAGVVLGKPTAPYRVSATSEPQAAKVVFEAPRFRGFTSITSYEIRCARKDHQRTTTSRDLKATVSHLRAGALYRCQVRARNGAGWSVWSASDGVTPGPA